MKTKTILNPSSHDFTITYDINEDNDPVSYTIHALQHEEFPEVIADHIAEHLATEIAFKEGWRGSNYDLKKEEVLNRIYND